MLPKNIHKDGSGEVSCWGNYRKPGVYGKTEAVIAM